LETTKFLSEQELVALLKQQNNPAFAYLYEKYAKALYNIIFQLTGDLETSNDILQQVFTTIWQKIQMYDTAKGRLFTWMLNITRNATIDFLRSKANKNAKQNQSLTNNVITDTIKTDGGLNIDTIGIGKFVADLKEDFRIVLVHSYYLGFTHEEIAENLQIPVGTVKTRIRASINQLRKKLSEN
jgi:RNA polymerase sigma-70 factor (ECF subfamily)